MATWNVRSLNRKEKELIDEFDKAQLDFLAITETKRKGQGMDELDKEHVFLYIGVSTDSRAAEGVGCLMKASYMSFVKNLKFILQNKLKIEITLDNSEITTILVTYGPNDDEPLKVKEEYWEELNDAIENVKGRMVILPFYLFYLSSQVFRTCNLM
ncbi:uncharacterized protein [Diabrotica undecimpunctata]|uniref:uncharacterized protein n=1 Tax=Diabrotica undecimpunctata TaxID=50387 RepID=UPI003B638CD6